MDQDTRSLTTGVAASDKECRSIGLHRAIEELGKKTLLPAYRKPNPF
jgi:hypothetical protein